MPCPTEHSCILGNKCINPHYVILGQNYCESLAMWNCSQHEILIFFSQINFSSNMPCRPLGLCLLPVPSTSQVSRKGCWSTQRQPQVDPPELLTRTDFSPQSSLAVPPHYSKASLQTRSLGNTWQVSGLLDLTSQYLHGIKIPRPTVYTLELEK